MASNVLCLGYLSRFKKFDIEKRKDKNLLKMAIVVCNSFPEWLTNTAKEQKMWIFAKNSKIAKVGKVLNNHSIVWCIALELLRNKVSFRSS